MAVCVLHSITESQAHIITRCLLHGVTECERRSVTGCPLCRVTECLLHIMTKCHSAQGHTVPAAQRYGVQQHGTTVCLPSTPCRRARGRIAPPLACARAQGQQALRRQGLAAPGEREHTVRRGLWARPRCALGAPHVARGGVALRRRGPASPKGNKVKVRRGPEVLGRVRPATDSGRERPAQRDIRARHSC